MAPRHVPADSSNESDSDAPEAVSLSQSKKQIQKLDNERKNAEIAMRESKRAQNRERDMKLKERAQKNKVVASKPAKGKDAKGKGKGKGKADEEDELQARMERAMAEAQEESGEDESDDGQEFEDFEGINVGTDEDDEDDGESGSDEDSDGGSEDDSEADDDDDEEEDDEAEEDDEEEDVPPPSKSQKIRFNPDHLPDELFAAAFASKPKRKTDVELDTGADPNPPMKKRKANAPKDIVVGYRAIRVLPSSTQPSVPSTLPSKKVEKFLDRTLALQGGRQPKKSWERRPTNIGVLRRNGPALNFVRSS